MKKYSRNEIYQITSKYAYSPLQFSASLFCTHYHLSEKKLFSIFQKAIIEWIISDEMLKLLKEKVNSDSTLQKGKKFFNRIKTYQKKRKEFHFSKKDTKYYALDFSASNLSLKEYAKFHSMPLTLLTNTLEKAMDEKLLSDDDAISLRVKAISDLENNSTYTDF